MSDKLQFVVAGPGRRLRKTGDKLAGLTTSECDLNQRHDVIVVLLATLEHQQVVIGASCSCGILAADPGPGMVDRAPTRFGIQKLARFTKDRIGFAAQDTFFTVQLREPLAGNFKGHAEMCSQPFHVPLSHLHALTDRATVPWAFRTVIITASLVVSRCGYHDRSECGRFRCSFRV